MGGEVCAEENGITCVRVGSKVPETLPFYTIPGSGNPVPFTPGAGGMFHGMPPGGALGYGTRSGAATAVWAWPYIVQHTPAGHAWALTKTKRVTLRG